MTLRNNSRYDDSYMDLIDAILDDFTFNLDSITSKTDISQSLARSSVRNLIACIEGSVYAMKCWALDMNFDNLSPQEKDIIGEKVYYLDDNGEIKSQKARIRIPPNMIFAFRILSQAEGVDNPLITSDHRWDSLKTAIKIRNRLVHPKSAEDLTLTSKDLVLVVDAIQFFTGNLVNIMTSIAKKQGISNT
jgi:hypothetical protein